MNFVFILLDDMGWADLGCYGSTLHQTLNIDRLASQGMKFTDAYAACPVCSPTRASILTGRYPARIHLTDWIPGHARPKAKLRVPQFHQHLPYEEVTIAKALKSAGYTCANIGKWHLGDVPYDPTGHGFDLNFGGNNKGQPPSYFYPYNISTITSGKDGEYLTDRLTDEAERFLDQNKDRPFLLYLAHFAVHTPLQAKPEMIAKYQARVKPDQPQNNPTYAAMVESVDESTGRIMAKLDELKLTERTVVIFTSDNGGYSKVTSNLQAREGKGTLYEGGLRDPLIVRWPGVVRPGSVCHTPVTSPDFYPTLMEIAGVTDKPKQTLDGMSFVPLLKQSGDLRRDAIYWHYPHYHPGGANPSGAVRCGEYKLIESYEDDHVELYNLAEDMGEEHDLAAKLPKKTAELREMLATWRKSVDASMPTPNPDYDPADPMGRPPVAPATPDSSKAAS